jgi:hypothetical protein
MAARSHHQLGTPTPNYYAADFSAIADIPPRSHRLQPYQHEDASVVAAEPASLVSAPATEQAMIPYEKGTQQQQQLVSVRDDQRLTSPGHVQSPSNDVLPSEAKAIDLYADFFEQVSVAAEEREEHSSSRERHPDAMVRWMRRGKRIAQMAAMVCDKFGNVAHRIHKRDEAKRERVRAEWQALKEQQDREMGEVRANARRRILQRAMEPATPSYPSLAPASAEPASMPRQNTHVHVILMPMPMPMSQMRRQPSPPPAARASSVRLSEVD